MMVGNAMEEGLFRQLRNPSHTDPARLGFLAGATAGFFASWALAQVVVVQIPGFLAVWVAVGLPVAVLVGRRIAAARKARKAAEMEARRAAHEAETARRIAAMKKHEQDANTARP